MGTATRSQPARRQPDTALDEQPGLSGQGQAQQGPDSSDGTQGDAEERDADATLAAELAKMVAAEAAQAIEQARLRDAAAAATDRREMADREAEAEARRVEAEQTAADAAGEALEEAALARELQLEQKRHRMAEVRAQIDALRVRTARIQRGEIVVPITGITPPNAPGVPKSAQDEAAGAAALAAAGHRGPTLKMRDPVQFTGASRRNYNEWVRSVERNLNRSRFANESDKTDYGSE